MFDLEFFIEKGGLFYTDFTVQRVNSVSMIIGHFFGKTVNQFLIVFLI